MQFSPACFCPPSWLRFGDADLTSGTLELCCRVVVPVGASSPAEARRFPMGFLSFTQEKGKYKALPYEKLGFAVHHHFCSLPFFSCRMLTEEPNRFVGCFGGFFVSH